MWAPAIMRKGGNALDDGHLSVGELSREEGLGAAAVGAVRLGEEDDLVAGDGRLVDMFSGHSQRTQPEEDTNLDAILDRHFSELSSGGIGGLSVCG